MVATAEIAVSDYDERWPAMFQSLCTPLRSALGALALRIEHVGSTAVPGLAARPIIDVDVVIRSRDDLVETIARLGTLGYFHEGDLGIEGREAFRATTSGLPEHHLYVCAEGASELQRHLAFRDYLRASAEARARYAVLKRALAARAGADRAAYVSGKSDFVREALSRG